MALSIIGAGMGRTGTLSLKVALEELGFGPCYHMMEVVKHQEFAAYWENAMDEDVVDWARIFDGYQSTVDWPAAHFYKELADFYPDAKIILTERDPERWFTSMSSTIFNALNRAKAATGEIPSPQMQMAEKLVRRHIFGEDFADRDKVIAVFEAYNDEVKRVIPAERLLVYRVSDGWAPLCAFLGRPVPDAPFPRLNSTEEFVGASSS